MICTWELFLRCISSETLAHRARMIEKGHKELESTLPAVSWQGYILDKERADQKMEVRPNGLFVLDIITIDEEVPELWSRIAPRREELGIMVAHKTYTDGLRLVAKYRPGLKSLAANKRRLAAELSVDYELKSCSSFASVSFLVPQEYFYHIDRSLFDPAVETPDKQLKRGSERTETKANEKIPQTSTIIRTLDAVHDSLEADTEQRKSE